MSKAFTRESDEDEEESEEGSPPRPQGFKNYITPAGAKRLQDELYRLKFKERPEVCAVVSWAAENGDRSENADYTYGKKKLREIDRRIRFLGKRLDTIVIVDPLKVTPQDRVLFGATVKLLDEDGNEKIYSIVGVDEVDLERGRISWISPLANALFKAQVGDYVTFRVPAGEREVEILEIQYIELP